MKKILSTLLLGAMMLAALASCGGEDSASTTTAAGTTTAPAATTTKAPASTTTEGTTETEDPRYVAETPMVDEEVATWMTDHEAGFLNSKIDMDSLLTTVTSFFQDGYYNNLFDDVFDATDWATAEAEGRLATQSTEDNGDGKMGFGGNAGTFYWGMTEPVKLGSYIIYTGNDNATYTCRLPVAWYILASNTAPDPNALINGDPDALIAAGWVELDYVYDGSIADADATPHGYKIDEANQGEYQYYCWLITDGAFAYDAEGLQVRNPDGDAIQVNGMKLYAAD